MASYSNEAWRVPISIEEPARALGGEHPAARAEGTLELKVHMVRQFAGAWDDDERIEQLLQGLERIEGVELKGTRRRWPRTPLGHGGDAVTLRVERPGEEQSPALSR